MKDRSEGRMVSLIGDAEMDEGNIYEALVEAGSMGPEWLSLWPASGKPYPLMV